MDITYILKGSFHENPPVISTVLTLLDLGHHVTIISELVNPFWTKELEKRGVGIITIQGARNNSKWRKLQSYIRFRKGVYSYLKRYKDTLVWLEGGHTVTCLGKGLLQYSFVLQILELHETNKMFLKAIGNVINSAEAVFVCEYNRAILYQLWFKMKRRPVVLPNKPYFSINQDELMRYKEKYKDKLDLLEGKKNIIYQGHIGKGRDLGSFVRAVKSLNQEYQIVLVGQNHGRSVERYKEIDSSIVHIDYMPAPDYLVFTAQAHMGIISYDVSSLNNIYCAPNKIWEYSKFGIPMLCNDIPGLKFSVEVAGAGLCVNEYDEESIKKAILEIDSRHSEFTSNSLELFNSVDFKEIVRLTLEKIS